MINRNILYALLCFIGTMAVAALPMPSGDPLTRYGTPEGTVLRRGRYAVAFDGATRQPRWTLVHLNAATVTGPATRDGLSFKADVETPVEFRPTPRDYAEPIYDIGHLVAANDFGNQDDCAATFTLSNACPQTPELNRGIWKKLEAELQREALTADVWIVSMPVWNTTDKLVRTMGPIRVAPAFGKAALIKRGNAITLKAWIIPHREETRKPLESYRVTTDTLEAVAGLDVWNMLPNAATLEAVK